jgi:hypothetical protein
MHYNNPIAMHGVSNRFIGDRAIVIYTLAGKKDVLYYHEVIRDGARWYSKAGAGNSGGTGLMTIQDDPKPLVSYRASLLGMRQILLGRALDPRVAYVEATFDTGDVRKDAIVDGIYALVGPEEATNICEMRVYDAQGVMLRRAHLLGRIANEPDLTAPASCQIYR